MKTNDRCPVLKSSGSSFEGFVRDEYTTLGEVSDRIFSTAVELEYTFPTFSLPLVSLPDNFFPDAAKLTTATMWDTTIPSIARATTLAIFASDESASVQATLFLMAQRILEQCPSIDKVRYALPNKHYIPVDMDYLGLENKKPANAEVFMPVDAPRFVHSSSCRLISDDIFSGLIEATISRQK